MNKNKEVKYVWFSKTIIVAVVFEAITLLESNLDIIQQLFGVSWFHVASLLLPLAMFYLRLITNQPVTQKRDNDKDINQ